MKIKLLNFLTFCLVTLVVLSPSLVVFSVVWERHMSLVQTQHLTCEVNQSSTSIALSPQHEGINLYRDKANLKFSDANFVKQSLTTPNYKIVKTLRRFFLLFPILMGIIIILYDRYLVYRAVIFQQQVDMLERLWQHSIE